MQLKFGKYKGMEISEIAKTEEGLQYLDWLKSNTDVKDPKYGKNNQMLVNEIAKETAGKTVYIKDKSQQPKSQAGDSLVHKKLDAIMTHLGITLEDSPF